VCHAKAVLDRLPSWKDSISLPATPLAEFAITPQTPAKTVVHKDDVVARWQTIGRADGPVEVLGNCSSGCTLVVAYVPKERLCFGRLAFLNFML
jgi:hypothetical protein